MKSTLRPGEDVFGGATARSLDGTCVAALTNGLRLYDFRAFGMWPVVDDSTCNVRKVT